MSEYNITVEIEIDSLQDKFPELLKDWEEYIRSLGINTTIDASGDSINNHTKKEPQQQLGGGQYA